MDTASLTTGAGNGGGGAYANSVPDLDQQIARFKMRVDRCNDFNKLQTYYRRMRRLLDAYRFWHERKRQRITFWEPLQLADESASYLQRWMEHRPPTTRLFRANAVRGVTAAQELTLRDQAEEAANAAELRRVQLASRSRATNVQTMEDAQGNPLTKMLERVRARRLLLRQGVDVRSRGSTWEPSVTTMSM
jgi:hypothetical protein